MSHSESRIRQLIENIDNISVPNMNDISDEALEKMREGMHRNVVLAQATYRFENGRVREARARKRRASHDLGRAQAEYAEIRDEVKRRRREAWLDTTSQTIFDALMQTEE